MFALVETEEFPWLTSVPPPKKDAHSPPHHHHHRTLDYDDVADGASYTDRRREGENHAGGEEEGAWDDRRHGQGQERGHGAARSPGRDGRRGYGQPGKAIVLEGLPEDATERDVS